MNKFILLALLMPAVASGQIMETFESGNISHWVQSPERRWECDNSSSISGILSLHHSFDNPAPATDLTGLSIKNLHPEEGQVKWCFKIRYGVDPSSSNNWAVYLISDTDPANFQGSSLINGFVAGVNMTDADDTLRLWKVKGGSCIPVVSSKTNWQTDIGTSEAVIIEVERLTSGRWILSIKKLNDELISNSTGNDKELFSCEWFILSYKYTSTRDRLLWIDDVQIDGIFREDKDPPLIVGCEVTGESAVKVKFNEPPSEGSLSVSGMSLSNTANNVVNILKLSSLEIIVQFEKKFQSGINYTLTINNICDRSGNCSAISSVDFSYFRAGPGDIIITEVMADPQPAVSLPEREYVEIFSRARVPVNLKKWVLTTESQSYLFPSKIIYPGEYLILSTAQDTILFKEFGSCAGFKSFPPLTDAGRILAVRDSSGDFIHGIEYSSGWYGSILKSGGGWSLEIIDKDFPFFSNGNWKASASRNGGTPGKQNSVSEKNPDNFFAGITNVFPADSLKLTLTFSETIIDMIKNINSLELDGRKVKTLHPVDMLYRKFNVILNDPLKKGKLYSLTSDDKLKDFAGNSINSDTFAFGLPEPAEKGDIIFNELLFNPLPGDADFIEFFNCSDKIIDVSRLVLVSVSTETGDTSSIYYLSDENRCFLPGDYYVLTTDKQTVIERFTDSDPSKIFETESMPSMPDDKGHLILFNRELNLIDEVYYDKNMHYPLIASQEGISLERAGFYGSSTGGSLWHSASEASGWGTPGIKNSIIPDNEPYEDQIVLSSTRITPDNDGNDDLLTISLKLQGAGNVVSVSVFDENGGIVKKLTENLLAGNKADIIWNGTTADNKLVDSGVYILLVTVFNDSGKVNKWKKVCAVIR